ncbi:MAG: response regulator [Desulfuromonadales bacterium]
MAHILVIDDEADMRFILTQTLTTDGYTVDSAENGKTAMKLVELNSYDLIITDIIMPEMDGVEVILEVSKKLPQPRIIAMTGGSDRLNRDMLINLAHRLRAHRVVSKPLDLKALRTAVTELMTN